MRVNHRGRVARLLCGLVFVGVCGKVKRAKAVSKSVGFARHGKFFAFDLHFGLLAQFHKILLECDFMQRPQFAGRQRAERFKPCGQRGADFHKAALAGFTFARRDFNVSRHAPNVRPIQAQQFSRAESGESANGDQRLKRGVFGGFQQRGKFARRVKFHVGDVGAFGAHGVGFVQTMRAGQVIFADCPLQKLPDGGAVVVA